MTNRQRRLLMAALIVGATGLGKLASVSGIPVEGTPTAPQSLTVESAYERCLSEMGDSNVLCDYRIFGERIYEDDTQGRWLCRWHGNRQCARDESSL